MEHNALLKKLLEKSSSDDSEDFRVMIEDDPEANPQEVGRKNMSFSGNKTEQRYRKWLTIIFSYTINGQIFIVVVINKNTW